MEAMPVQVAPRTLKAICKSNRGRHFTTKKIISIVSRSTRFALIIILRDTEDVVGAAVEEPRR